MGKSLFNLEKGYCCKFIEGVVKQAFSKRKKKDFIAIKYRPEYREFLLMDCHTVLHKRKTMTSGFGMSYCPFCRAKFPKSLRMLRVRILTKEYKVKDWPYHQTESKDIPPEFHTDEWWRKRGL